MTVRDQGAVTLGPPGPPSSVLYDAALSGAPGQLLLRGAGWSTPLPVDRWVGAADDDDMLALGRLHRALPGGGQILDLACGTGRHGEHLQSLGRQVLGVDTSRVAVARAGGRGVHALCTDALGPLPYGHHAWDGVLLLDGSVGLGGDPLLLLCRVRDLLSAYGWLLLELDPAGGNDRGPADLHDGRTASAPFRWARLDDGDGLRRAARIADLAVLDRWVSGVRRFALLGPGHA